MNTLTIGDTGAGKTCSLGQRYREAREAGAVVWSYATGGNAVHSHFKYAEWLATADNLTEMLDGALSAVISRAESVPSSPREWGPVRILLDDPEPDFYSGDTGQILKELARRGPTVGVEIHLTVSRVSLRYLPGDLRAQFTEVDLREKRANASQDTGAVPEWGETHWLTVTGETTREAFAALTAAIEQAEDATGLEVVVMGVNVDHSGAKLTAFYDLFSPSEYAPGVVV